MTIIAEYLRMVEHIEAQIDVPAIKDVFFPPPDAGSERSTEFGIIVLDDGSVGLTFVLLDDTRAELHGRQSAQRLIGCKPSALAELLCGADQVDRTVAIAAVNAIGQSVLRRSGFELDLTTDSVGLLMPTPGDVVGMVGLFPSLVDRVIDSGARLVVLERKDRQIRAHPRLSLSLDPAVLHACNKVLCTSSVMLNNSADAILANCADAMQVSVVGPTAGFLPDPLFGAGVDLIGATRVIDADELMRRCRAGERWMPIADKYAIARGKYPGFQALLEEIKQRER